MERVAISNTGTEAVMTAIRLARTVTNRTKVALFSGSYHGHFDGTLVEAQGVDGNFQAVPMAPGIPKNIETKSVRLLFIPLTLFENSTSANQLRGAVVKGHG